jgi:torulene dioxygenase
MITPAELNPNLKVDEPAPSPVGFKNVPAVDKLVTLQLEGQIPSWVNGVMFRSGMIRQKYFGHFSI